MGTCNTSYGCCFVGTYNGLFASPQFTPDQESAEARARWKTAYDVNLRAVYICHSRPLFSNFRFAIHQPISIFRTNINKIFLERGIKNTEALFVRIYDSENNSHGYENSIRPGSQTGNTKSRPSNLPSVKLVMAFPNSDGTPYDNNIRY